MSVSRSPSIALATYRGLPALAPSDQLLRAALARRGVTVEPVVWDGSADWKAYDVVVIRSCWDYHRRVDEFLRWVTEVDDSVESLVNSAALVRWNSDKRYLRDLEAHGVEIVPTCWLPVPAGADADTRLADLLDAQAWGDAVVKPMISASAHGTWRTSRARARDDQARFAAAIRESSAGLMVQPLLPEVQELGEWSLVFIGGAFSHAVLKRPAPGDFRVQHEHGGTAALTSASPALVADAGHVLRAAAAVVGCAPDDIVYARVDGVERAGRLVLMELECVEPELFLTLAPASVERLAQCILRECGRSPGKPE